MFQIESEFWDQRLLKPYALYSISQDKWIIKPPHLPDWSPESFPEGPALWKECEAVADYIESILELPEPYRTQQGAALYDHLHSDRHRAFGPNGEGWYDPGNVIEKYLDQLGLWAKLLHLKKNAEHGSFDDGEQPMLEALAAWDLSHHPAEHHEDLERFRDEWENSSHTSRALTGASAKVMGIPGYEHKDEDDWLGSSADRERLAHRALRVIHHDSGSPEPLYHGTRLGHFAAAQKGQEIRLPLTSTSGARSVAQAFASDHGRPGTVLEFPKGTPHFEQPGLDAENWVGADEDPYSVGEGVIAGHFRVAHSGEDEDGNTHLRLEHLGTFDPDQGEWVHKGVHTAAKTAIRLYHGTSAEDAARIRQEGLTSSAYDETHNTLSESPGQALEFARRKERVNPTVVALDVPEEAREEYLHPPYEYWGGGDVANTYALRKPLPPHFVANVKTASGENDDWTECDQGHEHWGTEGAAGMLIRRKDDKGKNWYLLQKRAPWVDHGNTWSIPGGAIGSDETPEEAAHRETHEEMGELPPLKHSHTVTDDHGGWAYHTVVADAPHEFHPDGGNDDEHAGHGWFTHDELSKLPLHPGFRKTWDRVRTSHPSNIKQASAYLEFKTQNGKRKGINHTTISAHAGNGDKMGHVRMTEGGTVVDDLHVKPERRGQGIGHALMDQAITQFGHNTLRLHASPFGKDGLEQGPLMDFYSSHGFEPEPDRGKGYMIRQPGMAKQAMTEEEAGHHRAKQYVQWQLERPHDEMEEEDVAPEWLHSQLTRGHKDFDRQWGKATADTKRNFRHHVNLLARKRIIIGTRNIHGILDDGRMKTLAELGPSAKPHHPLDDDGIADRHAYEHHVMGVDPALPGHERPIYGSLHDDPAKNHYGDVKIELKPHVRDRTTVTMGDSLNEVLRNYPINHVHRLGHHQIKAMTDPVEIEKLGSEPKPITYMEAQIHGGVKLSDIARVHLHGDVNNDGELSDEHKAMAEHARAKGLQVIHHRPDPFAGLSPKQRETLMRMRGKKTVRLNLGRDAYADYTHGMGSGDKITIVRPDGVIETTWGSLVAQSNGEILSQIPPNDDDDDEGSQKTASGDDYRLMHKPPTPEAGHKSLDHYEGGDPDDLVPIYRAVPHDVRDIEPNTWISTSPEYAHLHARHATDPEKDWPVLTAHVPRKHLYWDENDENEHGYHGPTIPEADTHDEESGQSVPREDFDNERNRRGLNKKPEEHMGTAVHLPPEAHAFVHDESRPVRERAEKLWQHLPEKAKAGRGAWGDDNIDASFDAEDAAAKLPHEPHRPTHVILRSSDRWEGNTGISWHPDHLHDEPNRYVDVDDDWHHHNFGGFRSEAATRTVPTNGGQGDVSDSMMVAIVPPATVAEGLALDDEAGLRVEELHITLLYLGKAKDYTAKQLSQLPVLVQQWAKTQPTLKARTQGAGTFVNEGNHVMWASVDIPGGGRMHDTLADFLRGHGIEIAEDHGFTPHITLKYDRYHVRFLPKIHPESWTVDEVWFCRAGEWVSYPLGR